MSQVEVDEVLGLCGWTRWWNVSVMFAFPEAWLWCTMSVPWVTKLPKLRPTMQCHVGPFRSSNCALVLGVVTSGDPAEGNHTVFLMYCAMSLPRSQLGEHGWHTAEFFADPPSRL